MEIQKTDDSKTGTASQSKKQKLEKPGLIKKLDLETAKSLKQLKDKINKKNFGRKIKDAEIISVSLGLIANEHIKALQETTLTERDRLNLAHEEYVKTNGKVSLDQFIGLLIRGLASQGNKTLEK